MSVGALRDLSYPLPSICLRPLAAGRLGQAEAIPRIAIGWMLKHAAERLNHHQRVVKHSTVVADLVTVARLVDLG